MIRAYLTTTGEATAGEVSSDEGEANQDQGAYIPVERSLEPSSSSILAEDGELDGQPDGVRDEDSTLSDRQMQILKFVALGLSNEQIATRLEVSRQTVGYHVGRLLSCLDAPTRAGLVAKAYVLGLLHPSAWPPASGDQ